MNRGLTGLEHRTLQHRVQKNRLSECFAWELVEKGIKAVATNPGPVHSDRIYKTVYPKALLNF